MTRPGSAGAWLLATRPRTLPAAAAPVVLAAGMAAARGTMAPLPATAALLGALLIQVATNLANDYFDARDGVDTAERVGPTRAVQAGLLPAHAVLQATLGVLGAAVVVGGYLVVVGGLPILAVGLASLACALAYSGGPSPLSRNGLGDLFVFLFFGLVAVGGTYWVQALALPGEVLLAGAGVGALTTAILVVNNLRDRETDARAGRRTMAVRLGRRGTVAEYLLLLLLAAAVPVVGIARFGWTPWTLLGWGAAMPILPALRRILTFQDPRALNPALGETARGVAWYAGLLAVGFLLGMPRG